MRIDRERQTLIVAIHVLKYLLFHSRAADTVDGIATWWLADMDEPIPRSVVEEALDYLVRQHVLSRKSSFNEPVYELNRQYMGH